MLAPKLVPMALALIATGSCRDSRPADPVILALGDEVVRRSDFEKHVAALEAAGEGVLAPDVKRALLDSYLEERVLVLEARSRGLLAASAGPEEERRGVQRLLAETAFADLQVSDDEVASYFGEHGDEFERPETVTVRQIMVPTLNEARDVRRRLQKEPRSFEVLARTLSRGPEAGQGGLMGVFARGQLPPELESASFALAPGGTSGIVETSLGFHVLRVEAREAARSLGLEEAQGRIREILLRRKSDRKVRQFVSDLMARAKVNHAAAQTASRPS
jgi:parvulin-like peptidyl-prolyl isomerase